MQNTAAEQINGKQSSPSKTQLLDEKVLTLQKQVEKYEQEIEQFEYMKSDWQTEKEALEEVLLGLRNQLKEKEASLNVAQAQRVSFTHTHTHTHIAVTVYLSSSLRFSVHNASIRIDQLS